jgi:hypothetical protein
MDSELTIHPGLSFGCVPVRAIWEESHVKQVNREVKRAANSLETGIPRQQKPRLLTKHRQNLPLVMKWLCKDSQRQLTVEDTEKNLHPFVCQGSLNQVS